MTDPKPYFEPLKALLDEYSELARRQHELARPDRDQAEHDEAKKNAARMREIHDNLMRDYGPG